MSDYLLADGFGNLSDGTHQAGVDREILGDMWSSFATDFAIEDRGDGRKWLKAKDSSDYDLDLLTSGWTGQSTIKICFRVTTSTVEACWVCTILDGANVLGYLYFDGSGHLVYRIPVFGGGYTDVHTSTATLPSDTETFYEVEIKFDNATGYVKVWVNGTADGETTGVDTIYAGSSCDTIRFFDQSGLRGGWKWSDIIVHKGTAPIGDVGVYYVESDTAGTDADFTASAGNNEDCVDEIGPDEDTTYNESDGTSGHRDSFTGDGISGVTVLSVCALARARKTGAGSASLKVGAVHGGSEDQSAAKSLSTEYLTKAHFVDDCPSTAAAWTTAQVTAAEASYEVV